MSGRRKRQKKNALNSRNLPAVGGISIFEFLKSTGKLKRNTTAAAANNTHTHIYIYMREGVFPFSIYCVSFSSSSLHRRRTHRRTNAFLSFAAHIFFFFCYSLLLFFGINACKRIFLLLSFVAQIAFNDDQSALSNQGKKGADLTEIRAREEIGENRSEMERNNNNKNTTHQLNTDGIGSEFDTHAPQ